MIPTDVTCSVCGEPIDVHHRIRGGTCGRFSCRAKAAKRQLAQQQAQQEAMQEAVASSHLQTLLAGRQERATDVAKVVIAGSIAALQAVPSDRREKLRESIVQAIRASEDRKSEILPEPTPAADSTPPSSAIAAACATCRGFCCRSGGDSAYIDANVISRVRSQRPELSREELISLYMDAIPEHSVERSCIYHGDHGCTLPRELRSHICNSYYCWPMREWMKQPARTESQPTAVIILHEDRVVRSALLEAESSS